LQARPRDLHQPGRGLALALQAHRIGAGLLEDLHRRQQLAPLLLGPRYPAPELHGQSGQAYDGRDPRRHGHQGGATPSPNRLGHAAADPGQQEVRRLHGRDGQGEVARHGLESGQMVPAQRTGRDVLGQEPVGLHRVLAG
jgi:hypothetical protein